MTTSRPTIPSAAGMRVNEGCEYREQIGPEADGMTVLAYLSRRYEHSSAGEWAERILSGQGTLGDVDAFSA